MRKLPYKSRGSIQAVGKHPRGLQGRTAPQFLPRLMSDPTHTDGIASLPQSSTDRLKSSAGFFLKQSIPRPHVIPQPIAPSYTSGRRLHGIRRIVYL